MFRFGAAPFGASVPSRVFDWIGRLVAIASIGIPASGSVWAKIPPFRIVSIEAAAEYPACAVFDVNRDGTLDVFSGGAWYEFTRTSASGASPSRAAFEQRARHFVRDVEVIRGRFDDYSNLPYDVDGDGWTDVISANYRSQSIYWVRNPGSADHPWSKHVVDTPGPMETARLVDLNADGRVDLLPNGSDFAAWWELPSGAATTGAASALWTRHVLPAGLAGHGIGAGDLNGDGRIDLVGPSGWFEAGGDGSWIPRPEFRLHRDASIPVLVHDVDADGDADLIWGRGHHVGLYWMERIQAGGAAEWRQHTIDSSWSQAHSLLVADLDGDDRPELITGPRYLGHEGRDLGEYDPLALYAYAYETASHTWSRGTIHRGGRVAFGLDPKTADLDGDGDLDLVVADRSGLYLAVNLSGEERPNAESADLPLFNHRDLLRSGASGVIDDPFAWGVRRAAILDGMREAMGVEPDASRRVPLDARILDTADAGTYLRKQIRFTPEPGDSVPAFLLVPKNQRSPGPAMLCLHQTTGIGKGEPAGLGGLANLHYADELAKRGYVCLVPDYPSFGDYPYDFAAARDRYASGSMKAIWNNMRAVDLLEAMPEVDPDRIGVIGHSLGGHNALFTAAFDQRLRAVVTSCGFTAFHHYYEGNLAGWTSDRYMPRIRDRFGNDPNRVPFDFFEVLGAIAPRSVFVNAPTGDSNFAVEGVREVEAESARVYALLRAEGRVRYVYPECGHDFPPETREACYEWLDAALGAP
ncbi:MAG: alpha/beta fold hydrolase [Planctomycetes bacterium]|nr:alpha/beta fold hydrolase [Planctomycetota bacterium]